MISRKIAGASAAGIGAATAVAALLLGTVSGSAADEPTASAYGLAAEGLLPIAPTPQVEAPPDGTNALLELPSPLGVGVLKVQAAGHTSDATAVDLNIADLIKAEVIKASCDNGSGDASILGGTVAGSALPEAPAVGEGLDLSPIASIKTNRQTNNDDGTLTVDALVVSVLPGSQGGAPLSAADLDQLRKLLPNLNVPTMEQLQAPAVPSVPGVPAVPGAPAVPAVPTVDDLLKRIQELNPNLQLPGAGSGPLLEVVISSATCGAPAPTKPTEAPKPKPVETQLPVTH
ncbi:MAG TPA: choice-of-anchor P family protein [Pseudonocardiaceae bacterium]|nr:choice-of-anchor P family protein [Pseudonocardiaceae bacterium]